VVDARKSPIADSLAERWPARFGKAAILLYFEFVRLENLLAKLS
jgi:hypothetical protein